MDFSSLSLDELILQSKANWTAKKQEELKQSIVPNGVGHAVGYTRVSTEMQVEEGSSLSAQEKQIEEYCKSKNLILDKLYIDPAMSGADRNRPKLREMLDSLGKGMKVVTYSIDRLSRDTAHLLDVKNEIHKKGCTLYLIDKMIDTADPSHDFLITMLAAVGEEQRKSGNKRISSVMQNMSREGKLRGKPKYGWKVITGTDGKTELVEDIEEQRNIAIIRKLIQDDPKITLSEIARRLTAADIHLRKSAKIYTTTIKNIIDHNNLRSL